MATDVIQHSLGVDMMNALLVECAIEGDDSGARRALALGADPKASDAARRTALTCALTGESWKTVGMAQDGLFMSESRLGVLDLIVSHAEMSIYELNAPQDSLNGVTVLGMAAWLNLPSAVEVLLRASSGRLLVDSIDAHGATPLMYACRDGNMEVVQWLLAYGARPDVRDLHSRTSVQFALLHPRVLWLCEGSLRRRRSQDAEKRNLSPSAQPHTDILLHDTISSRGLCTPPSLDYFSRAILAKSADSLITAITSTELPLLHSLLFPQPPSVVPTPSSSTLFLTSDPLLVNLPDASGWSAIHYCVSVPKPSVEVLDALYRAGAEISLFTRSEQWTPLHCLARHARNWDYDHVAAGNMYRFVMHLVKDLRAPLAAKDRNENTCIHIAAEHGENIEVLMALLDCDVEGAVRNMRNAQGLTPLDVAHPRYKVLLGGNAGRTAERPVSAMSVRTLKAKSSFTHSHNSSLPNTSHLLFTRNGSPALPETASAHSDPEANATFNLAQGILDNLTYVSRSTREGCTRDKVDELLRTLEETTKKSRKIFAFYTSRLENATKEVEGGRKLYNRVDGLWTSVRDSVNDKRAAQEADGQEAWNEMGPRHRRQTTDSGDSQRTAVSRLSGSSSSGSTGYKNRGVATSPNLLHIVGTRNGGTTRRRLVQLPAWLDGWMANSPSPPRDGQNSRRRTNSSSTRRSEDVSSTGSFLSRRRSRAGSSARDSDRSSIFFCGEDGSKADGHGAAKLKTWLKRMIGSERASKLGILMDLDGDECAVGRQVRFPASLGDHLASTAAGHRSMPDLAEGQWLETEGTQTCAFRECDVVLETVRTDLDVIAESLKAADQFILSAQRAMGQTDRMTFQAIEVRKNALQSALRNTEGQGLSSNSDLELFSSDPTTRFIGSLASARTSMVSVASTLAEGDDEDTRFLRKLMTRKIEAKIDGAFDEVDKSYAWLRLVRDVLVTVKRRTNT
ncbi:ankyrin [Neolentinus lepideus HHB14362 ss-1]|uniref:Ankyrin n=1 Tax=Neolentinus lepideus HHB14362 ss-1 TaxID=1314782 RepID=A0A165NL71_9AGAM|nr:ankyrin [Neolentinus lepideus HHB14362 ss-1]